VTSGSPLSTAIGAGATAAAPNSTAIGAGATATATAPNQMVLGTTVNTCTAPGITSAASLAAQSGPVQVVTSDAGGNLATDHGFLFNSINRLNGKVQDLGAGVAIASSLSTPDRTGSQTWAVALNWSGFEGFNAMSGSAIAAIAHDMFFPGDMISLAGSAGGSFERNQVAGRVSLQIAGGGYQPLK
jgi:trimeric autotransporter adhesin